MSIRNLESLLEPASVAVIGASDRPASLGATVWRNLRAGSFKGPVHAVNPRLSSLDGQPVFGRIADLPQAPNLAVICTPPATVAGLVCELGERGTRAAIVMTAGLSAAQKQAMLEAARVHLLRILGPNCLGLLTPHLGLNASFAHIDALPGDLAFVSQSGALVTAMLDWATSRRIGFSRLISLGEHADVDFGDLLDWLASDPHTRSILLYIESVEQARKFMSAARAAARNKPVIVVKAGRAGGGIQAAASHTGAMAGSDIVFDAAIRRAGMLRVDTLGELFTAAQTLAHFGAGLGARLGDRIDQPFNEALLIVTNGGGAGVMAADAAAAAGVPLQSLPRPLRDALDRALPPTWSRANPIDIIGDAPVERYISALNEVFAAPKPSTSAPSAPSAPSTPSAPSVDSSPAVASSPSATPGPPAPATVLFMHAPTAIVRSDDIARACLPIARAQRGRLMACWLGEASVAAARRLFIEAGVADYATPEEAVHAFQMLITYRRNQAMLMEAPARSPCPNPAPEATPGSAASERRERSRAIVDAALARGGGWLDEDAVESLLRAYGIPTVPRRTVALGADAGTALPSKTLEALDAAAAALGWPVVLKIRSPDITHKSEVGGVVLDLRDAEALRRAATAMQVQVHAKRPAARIEGFTVQAMVSRPRAQELIVGASVDPSFGPVLLFGAGGTAVEVMADRAIGLPPLNETLAREMVSRTRVARLLAGYRDRPPARVDAVCDVLVAVSQMQADLAELAELDINPLLADDDGVLALDARIRIERAAGAGAAQFAIRPYPSELEEQVAWQGRTLLLRPIRPDDGPSHQAFAEQLSPEDLRLRFFQQRRELPRSEIARLTQIDYAREMAFIAAFEGEADTLGVVRAITDPDNVEAEFAIIVRSDLHHGGLGRLLLDKIVRYCHAEGTQRLVGVVLPENRGMIDLARDLGFEVDAARSDRDGVRLVRRLNPPPGTATAVTPAAHAVDVGAQAKAAAPCSRPRPSGKA